MASFIDLFPAIDPEGVSAAKYRLHFLGSPYLHQDSWVFGMAAELTFTVYKCLVTPANALLGVVFSSGAWLQPLSEVYGRIVGPLYEEFPPWVIACVGLAIVAANLLNSRVKSTEGGLFTSEALTRLGVALGMMALVAVLASNPFAVIQRVLELDSGLASDFAAKVTRSGNGGVIETGQALVDQSIRTPAIALNYGREFSGECKQLWSEAMAAGQELSVDTGCFVKDGNQAGPDTVVTGFVMWFLPALPMLAFSAIAAWKYIVHISMSVLAASSVAWVASSKVHHRRGFERVSESFARAGAHIVMFVIIAAVTVALPATCSGIAMQVIRPFTDPDAQSYLMMVTLGVGFLGSTWVIWKVSSNHGALVRVLQADAKLTLEHTLGIRIKPNQTLKLRNMGFWKFNPFAGGSYGEDVTDEVASPGRTFNVKKGMGDVAAPHLMEDPDAVRQLSASAMSAAEARAAGAAESSSHAEALAAAASVAPDGMAARVEHHYNSMWQMARNFTAASTNNVVSFGDVYGYYTDNSSTASSTTNSHADTHIDGEVIGVIYDDDVARGEIGWRQLPSPSYGAGDDPPTAAELTAAPPEPVAPAGGAAVRPHSVPDSPVRDEPLSPVAGNVYADTSLNRLAEAARATFEVAPAPTNTVVVESPLPGFDGQQGAVTSGPFAVMPAPAVRRLEIDAGTVMGADTVEQHPELVNDQQRWNRGGWRSRPVADETAAGGAESPAEVFDQPVSGIHPGVNMHPAGFLAPMRDFIAADDLRAQLDEVRLVLAAAGESAVVVPPGGDARLGLRLSSDPDERVVRACDAEFGDPL